MQGGVLLRKMQRKVRRRWELFHHARTLTLAERIRLSLPRGETRTDAILRRRLTRDPDGRPVFDMGGERIYFTVDGNFEPALETGALVVLREAYLENPIFFRAPVILRPGDRVLDLGGNFGTSAITFARAVGSSGHVWSFEPVFDAALSRSVAANGVAGRVTVVPAAVGSEAGTLDFVVSRAGIDSRFQSKHGNGPKGEHRRVPVITIDGYVREHGIERVDFIKADIEGAEELAIRGARDTIARFKPKWTISSYHTDLAGDKQHPKLLALLKELGYTVRERPGFHIWAW